VKLRSRSRMETDARREQLLNTGLELLGQRPYDQVSIDEIARAAGVSKGLLYHYFPTKKDFVLAVLREATDQLGELTAPDPSLSPVEQVDASLDAFLGFVEDHAPAYSTIFRTRGGGDEDIRAALEEGRELRLEAVLAGIAMWGAGAPPPARSSALETAVQGWIFFVEGAVLRWLERGGLERAELRTLLRLTLLGALQVAQEVDARLELDLPGAAQPEAERHRRVRQAGKA
jgi:AcrR family transcriptional regulator